MAITIPIVREGATPPRRLPSGAGASRLTALPPLSLYLHVPWCVRKCPYCDFNSHAAPAGPLPEAAYLEALRGDIEQALPLIWGRQVMSVFIGGGTPSLLSAATIDTIMGMLRAHFNLIPDAEVTLEANPGTAEADRFKAYAASGINRLSLGIQTFDDVRLKTLGRIHDAAQARAAIEMAQQAVARVNLDIMFALPGQTLETCTQDVREALSFGTEHLSLYHLTMEPNTVFAKYPPAALPDDDDGAAMQDAVADLAESAGLQRYEVSAYARPGARSRHNMNYWTFGDYLGLGPGAHGKLSFHDRIIRQARVKQPDSWMAGVAAGDGRHIGEDLEVQTDALPFEFMLNALRLRDGVPTPLFETHTGLSVAQIAHQLEAGVKRGLMSPDPGRLQTTPLGWQFLNDTQALFL
ncbi:radical SAM family heme chaperone HemW [Schauerella aestuarii]|uniref:radical SAM family heme chaperone HemW n=1 Tax=Schauerella aestuarii TaxID=2511204 RepID=UPI00136E1815|nr:radical SAM family heme chaperone HemW [Achromobacter aestuarii]MYZ44494.1 oxygen-independent coproporphyrinogen III oxidase-like protein [Achromobacter aestuarii]